MTKVLVRQRCCAPSPASLQLRHGAEDLLDRLYRTRPAGGFPAADLVGSGRDRSHPLRRLVGRLPQRLVLNRKDAQQLPSGGGLRHGEAAARGRAGGGGALKGPTSRDRAVAERIRSRVEVSGDRAARKRESIAARAHRKRERAAHHAGRIVGHAQRPALGSPTNWETAPRVIELKAGNADVAAAERELRDKAESGRSSLAPEQLRRPDPAGRGLHRGRAATATVQHERDQQQHCNFLHEFSLTWSQTRNFYCKITEMRAGRSMDATCVTIPLGALNRRPSAPSGWEDILKSCDCAWPEEPPAPGLRSVGGMSQNTSQQR